MYWHERLDRGRSPSLPCNTPRPLPADSLDGNVNSEHLRSSCHEPRGVPAVLGPTLSPPPENFVSNAKF